MREGGITMQKKHFLLVAVAISCVVLAGGIVWADPNDVEVSPPVAAAQMALLTEQQMAAAKPMEILIIAEEEPMPQVFPPAAYTYPFPFTRLEVFNVKKKAYKKYPYKTIGQLFFTIPGAGNYRCSASVGHNSWVWTAGHCVCSPEIGTWHTNFTFIPGVRKDKKPYGTWAYDNMAASLAGWVSDRSLCYDIGIARFQRNAEGKSLEEVVGALGFLADADRKQHWNLFGYPSVPPFDGTLLIQAQASIGEDDPFQGCEPKTIGVGNDMTGGCSGGPWIVEFNKSKKSGNYINGVNSYKYTSPSRPLAIYGPYFGTGAQNLYDYMKDNPN
jgi:V8-like Glu-specific endopeptidase